MGESKHVAQHATANAYLPVVNNRDRSFRCRIELSIPNVQFEASTVEKQKRIGLVQTHNVNYVDTYAYHHFLCSTHPYTQSTQQQLSNKGAVDLPPPVKRIEIHFHTRVRLELVSRQIGIVACTYPIFWERF